MNCKKIILNLAVLLAIFPVVSADKVGVVISFPGGSVHGQCLEVAEGTNGYYLLKKLPLETLWAGPGTFGHQLCQIDGVGDDIFGKSCSYSGSYWGLFIGKENSWDYMPVGFDGGGKCWNGDINSYSGHYCADNGDIIGLNYGEFGETPDYHSFSDVCNPLKIKDIKVYVDGKKQINVDEEGGTIKASPNSRLLFEIELVNDYLFNDEIKIEYIEAEISIENLDEDDDIEENVEFRDLDANEKDKSKIKLNLPNFAEEGEYDLRLKITGEAYGGNEQEIVVDYTLKATKEKHNLVISKAELKKSDICPGKKNILFIEVTNFGKTNEKNVVLTTMNDKLGLDFTGVFNLDEGDSKDNFLYKKEIEFTIPNSTNPGEYSAVVELNYDGHVEEEVALLVKDCSEELLNVKKMPHNEFSMLENNQKIIQKPIKQIVPRQTYQDISFFKEYTVPILLASFTLFLTVIIVLIVLILRL